MNPVSGSCNSGIKDVESSKQTPLAQGITPMDPEWSCSYLAHVGRGFLEIKCSLIFQKVFETLTGPWKKKMQEP